MDKSIRERCEHQASQEEIATLGPTVSVARPQTPAELYAEDFPRDAVNSYVLSVRLTYLELVELRAQVNEFYGKAGDLWRLEKLGGADAELLSHARRVGRELCVLLCVLEKELEGYGAPGEG